MKKALERRIDAAMGRIPCDTVIKNVQFFDAFSCVFRAGDISIMDGTIVCVAPGLKGKSTVNGKGKWIVPGFIDAHVHIESSMMVPAEFAKSVLQRGTTTAICDPHELTNVIGVPGLKYFLNQAEHSPMDLRVMLSSCVPATPFETNGGGNVNAAHLVPLRRHPKVLGLAEMMNIPGVLNKDSQVLHKLIAFSDSPIDGHAPLVSGKALAAYISAGIRSCHESSELKEAQEKLLNGMSVWIREGSVAKDLAALSPLLSLATSPCIGFCTDDRNPLDIATEGHIDHLVRTSIALGLAKEIVYRSSAWAVARHYGLKQKGAIAPGYDADLVLLNDADRCDIHSVWVQGTPVSELCSRTANVAIGQGSVRASSPTLEELQAPIGKVHVIEVIPGKILTGHNILRHNAEGVQRLTVLERYGNGRQPANGYVYGFGKRFRGAIGSSVGHDSHNLIAVGHHPQEMQIAFNYLIENGGGFCVVQNQQVIADLPLPIAGLMTLREHKYIEKKLHTLRAASREIGCTLQEPFLQLAFLSLPVIPKLKLTDRGLFDVDKRKIIAVNAL